MLEHARLWSCNLGSMEMTKSSVSLSDKCVWHCHRHIWDTAVTRLCIYFFYHFLKEERKKVGFLTKLLLVLAHLSLDLVAVVPTTALWWSSLVLVSTHQNWYHWCLSRHIGIALAASVLALAHWLSLFVVMLHLFCLFLISFLIYFCLGKVQELEASSNWVTACWSFA